ncbi:hypothetical protein EYF80_000507 [Liparis tanakae]|uniref:Uncharacterized protein n=1 Tax=Liparis tanakae TaxID=230148 RepID=A0A4Z2JG31_9TELE|nr:hypothetical protein EYF80_000507 [Liparis tanakae]
MDNSSSSHIGQSERCCQLDDKHRRRATEGESDGGRDGGGGLMGIGLFRGCGDAVGGREEMGGGTLPFFPSNTI